MTSDDDWAEHLRFQIKCTGAAPSPMDCFLLLRATKTLHLRMERHCANGAAVAHHLRAHPAVADVRWPGFEDHPGHDVAKKQMRGFGGMLSFTLKDDAIETAVRFMAATRVFALAESLGGVESLVSHPASMTHGSIPADVRRASGLPEASSASRSASRTRPTCWPTSTRPSLPAPDARLSREPPAAPSRRRASTTRSSRASRSGRSRAWPGACRRGSRRTR